MFTIELGKDIYANPTLYLKNATFSSRLKVVSKSVGVDKKNNRFMTSGMDYLVVGEYDFAIVDGSKEYPFVIKLKIQRLQYVQVKWVKSQLGLDRMLIGIPTFMRQIYRELLLKANVDTSTASTQDVQVKISDRFGNSVTKNVGCGRSIMKKADKILIVCIMIVAVVLCVPLFLVKMKMCMRVYMLRKNKFYV